jgi:hypothetical protein
MFFVPGSGPHAASHVRSALNGLNGEGSGYSSHRRRMDTGGSGRRHGRERQEFAVDDSI